MHALSNFSETRDQTLVMRKSVGKQCMNWESTCLWFQKQTSMRLHHPPPKSDSKVRSRRKCAGGSGLFPFWPVLQERLKYSLGFSHRCSDK